MSARVVDVFFMHRAGVGFNLASLHGSEVQSRDVYLSPESDALLRQCGTITIRVVDPNAQRRRKERIRTSNPRDVPLSVALSLWTKLEEMGVDQQQRGLFFRTHTLKGIRWYEGPNEWDIILEKDESRPLMVQRNARLGQF